jgi:hypothetical protein
MPVRTTIAGSLAVLAIVVAGCGGGGSKSGLEVGACTNADPTQALSFDVKAVDCDSKDAKSKVVRAVKKSGDCDVASVSDSAHHKVYCTEPYPPGSAPTKPAVGACTTADPKQLVSVNIRLVNCDDPTAKSRIVKRVSSESQCKDGSVRGQKGEVFCIEPT